MVTTVRPGPLAALHREMNGFHPVVRVLWWTLLLPLALAAWAGTRTVKSSRILAYVGAGVLACCWIGGAASAAGGSGQKSTPAASAGAPVSNALAATTTAAPPPVTAAPTTQAPVPSPVQSTHSTSATDRALSTAQSGTALAAVNGLTVKGRAPMTGYSREQFGQAWYDYDRNGCDTRNDILRRDLKNQQIKAGTHGCKVLAGDAEPDPYTGSVVHFVYGGASEIDIDHVVPLGDAWQKGAQQWSGDQRLRLANDPLNLLAVSASANRQKGDADTATWLPSNKAYRCQYVARQVAVKRSYGLWVTSAERDAMVRVLSSCPAQPLPSAGAVPLAPEPAPVHTTTAPPPPAQTYAPPPVQTQAPAPPPAQSALDPQFGTCKEAIAHGYGPYVQGTDPEYDWYRDADHDGIDCER